MAVKDLLVGEHRDYEKERPVPDEVFRVCKSLYAYEKAPLHAHIESTDSSAESIHQTITFDAAYGKERVIAHLYLPRKGKSPHQTVVFFPWINFFGAKDLSSRKTRRTRFPCTQRSSGPLAGVQGIL